MERKIQEHLKRTYEKRGEFISGIAMIEQLVNDIIAQHLCKKEKNFEMIMALVSRVGFEFKVSVLREFLNKDYGNIYTEMVTQYKKRNNLAHLITQSDSDKDYSTLDKFYLMRTSLTGKKKDKSFKTKLIPYTFKEHDQNMKKINEIVGVLNNIR